MRVTVVDGDISFPPNSGKRLRTLNLMLPLAGRHEITYVARGDTSSAEAKEAEVFFRDHNITPVFVHDPIARKSGPLFYARLAANLLSPLPYSVRSHESAPMRAAIKLAAHERPADVWQFEWSAYMPMLEASVRAPRLLIAHNVDTLIWQRYYDTETGLARKLFLKQQWHKFERFEAQAFRDATRVVAVSEDDARIIRERFQQPATDVVDNGIERQAFEHVEGKRDRHKILFLGALDWRPNVDAVERLLTVIFPALKAQNSSARLVIVGRKPSPALARRIQETAGAELHADVADVKPYLGDCGVMVVPLRVGGGSRLKILEALASGLPVISTAVGAEGLTITPDRHYWATEEADMADAIARFQSDPEPLRQLTRAARALVLASYDWNVLAKKLEASWERCATLGTPIS